MFHRVELKCFVHNVFALRIQKYQVIVCTLLPKTNHKDAVSRNFMMAKLPLSVFVPCYVRQSTRWNIVKLLTTVHFWKTDTRSVFKECGYRGVGIRLVRLYESATAICALQPIYVKNSGWGTCTQSQDIISKMTVFWVLTACRETLKGPSVRPRTGHEGPQWE